MCWWNSFCVYNEYFEVNKPPAKSYVRKESTSKIYWGAGLRLLFVIMDVVVSIMLYSVSIDSSECYINFAWAEGTGAFVLQNLSCMSAHGSEHGPRSQHTCVCTINLGADHLYAFPMVEHYRSESSGNLPNTHLEKKSNNLLCLEMD